MSYTLTLQCGCTVYVARNPITHIAHTRILQTRGPSCTNRRHEIGTRLFLWELLPDRGHGPGLGPLGYTGDRRDSSPF